eukprot:TRINITY_DN14971_c0_g1_i1.p1 TRINITY_DN14971_c0_g1~~TRINITY_DN14971_c0_g1_i1.p1  ORF type:complete len:401 (+),score=143.58 TRINITY_DN14971_c0_g1_i1:68-1270(+)
MDEAAVEEIVAGLLRVVAAAGVDAEEEDPQEVEALVHPASKEAARGLVVQEVERVKNAVEAARAMAAEKRDEWDMAAVKQYLWDMEECVDVLFAEWFDMELSTSEMRRRLHGISTDVAVMMKWAGGDEAPTSAEAGAVAPSPRADDEACEVSEEVYLAEAQYFARHRLKAAPAASPLVYNAVVLCSTADGWALSKEWVGRVVPEARCVLLHLGSGYGAVVFEAAEQTRSFLAQLVPEHPLLSEGAATPDQLRQWAPVPAVTDLFLRLGVSGDQLTTYRVVSSDFSKQPVPADDATSHTASASVSPEPAACSELEEVVAFKAPVRYVAAAGAVPTALPAAATPLPLRAAAAGDPRPRAPAAASVRAVANKKYAAQWDKWKTRSTEAQDDWEAERLRKKRRF